MKTPRYPVQKNHLLTSLLIMSLGFLEAHAADQTWIGQGDDANWQTPGNWLSGTPPSAGDSLIFTQTTGLQNTNNFVAGTGFGGLVFQSPAGAFELNGKSITLNGNITNNQVVTEQTINLSLALGMTPTVDVSPNAVLTLNGALSGSHGLTKVDGGSLGLNGANTFNGVLTVDGGKVAVGSDANLGAAPGSATAGKIVLNGGALDVVNGFTLNANRGIAVGSASGGSGTITVETGETLNYSGVIADNGGTGGFTKNGYGTLALSGQSTYSGATSNRVGALTLDFSQAGSPTDNIIPSGSDLTLGGENAGAGAQNEAQLNVIGKDNTVNSQSFNSTHLTFAGSIVQATSGAGGTINLNLGALSHDPGGALLVLPPQNNGGAGNIATTSGNLNGLLGGYATIGDGTTYSANGYQVYYSTNFAAVDGSGNIVNFTDYFTWLAGNLNGQVTVESNLLFAPSAPSVITVDNANANSLTEVNTINISAPDSGSTANYYGIYIGDGNTLRLGQYGGILKTDRSRDVMTIGGVDNSVQSGSGTSGSANIGTLTAGGADNTDGEIVMTADGQDESHGTTIFESTITDNGSGKVAFVKMGPGSIKLDGHNTFSGGLYLLQGRVQFAGHELDSSGASDNPDGGGTGPIYILPGSYLFPSGIGSGVITNDIYLAGRGTAAEPLGAIRSGNFSSTIHLIGDAQLGGGTYMGPIVGNFNLGLCMPATTHGDVHLSSPSNDWTGDTFMNAEDHSGTVIQHVYNETNEVIPDGFGRGNVTMEPGGGRSTSYIVWDLQGFNETINGLSTSGNHVEDCLITNGATAGDDSVLTVGNNDQSGTFAGLITDGGSGSGALGLTKIGGGVETLTGVNTYSGDTTVSGGTLALAGSGSIANSANIIVQNNALLDVSSETAFNYPNIASLNSGNLKVSTGASVGTLSMADSRLRVSTTSDTGNLTANTLNLSGTTNYIDIVSLGLITQYPVQFTVLKYSGSINGTFNFGLGNVPGTETTGYVSNNVANSSIDVVLLTGPAVLTWTGNNGSAWDVGTTTNWLAFGTTPAAFHNVDSVIFPDGASTGTVSVNDSVVPGSVEFTNDALDYILTGANGIGGLTSMTKDGAAKLTIDNGNNTFSGGLTINNGTVQVGNNDTSGNLPSTGGVENEGALVFDRTDALTVSAPISGGGSLSQSSAGVLTLSGNNTFTGPATVSQGTVRAGSDTALGTADGTTTVNSGATLDVNGQTLNTEPVVVSGAGVGGNGAIINSGAQSLNAMGDVTLTGDTSFGGTGRWDIRGGAAQLVTSPLGSAYTVNKVGTNYIAWVGIYVDSGLGDINVQGGTLSIETSTSGLGDPSHTLTVSSGATLQFYNTTLPFSKQFTLNGNGTTTTVNCSAGNANSVGGSFTLNGSCLFGAGSGNSLTLSGTMSGSGSFTKIGAGINILASGATASYTGGTTISNGTYVLDGSLSGSLAVESGAALHGVGSASGAVTIAGGSLSPGDTGIPQGMLTLGSLSLNDGSATFELSDMPSSGNDQVSVSGALTLSGVSTLQIVPLSFMNVGDEYTLIQYGGTTLPSSATNNLTVTSALPGFSFSVVDPATTPNAIKIRVDQALGNDYWTGQSSSTWDFSAVNWTRSGNPVAFNDGDYATFDDSSSVTNVMITGTVNISGLTVSSGGEAYNFGGTGSLVGNGGLYLGGMGLTIANTGTNSFTGPISIDYGTLQIGNGGTGGSLGSGVMTNMGTLVLDRSDDGLTISNNITGSGSVANQGTGMVTLTGANTFSGEVDVESGTVRTLSSSALGDVFSGTVVSNGAALDIGANNVNLSKEPITVSGSGPDGSGAIVNSSGSTAFVGPNIGQLTLTGDTTIGGSGRIDYRASSATANDVALYAGGQPYTLTKSGTNLLQLAGVQIDPSLGDINVQAGTLGIQWYMPYLGDSSKNLTVFDGATLAFYDMSNAVTKVLILNNGASVDGLHGDNEFDGPVTLTGSNTFSVTGGTLTFANTLSGTGDLIKTGGSKLVLSSATETYTGNTYVNGGTLALMDPVDLANSPAIVLSGGTIDVSGRSDGTLPVGSSAAQILAGGGNITGNLSESAGSTVNPGNNTGTAILNVSGSVTLNGAVIMNLNRANAQTSDEITASSFTAGGVLTVTNLGPDLVTNDKFQLFSSAVSGFASVNLPTKNASGTITYQWQNDLGTDGSITLLSGGSGVNTTPTNIVFSVSGGNLTISWPSDHLGWTLQAQTNSVGSGLGNNWVDVPGSTTTTSMVIPISPDNGSVFYRMKYQP